MTSVGTPTSSFNCALCELVMFKHVVLASLPTADRRQSQSRSFSAKLLWIQRSFSGLGSNSVNDAPGKLAVASNENSPMCAPTVHDSIGLKIRSCSSRSPSRRRSHRRLRFVTNRSGPTPLVTREVSTDEPQMGWRASPRLSRATRQVARVRKSQATQA